MLALVMAFRYFSYFLSWFYRVLKEMISTVFPVELDLNLQLSLGLQSLLNLGDLLLVCARAVQEPAGAALLHHVGPAGEHDNQGSAF